MGIIMKFYATEDKVKITGRTIFRQNIRYLGYSTSSVSFTFTGKSAQVTFISDPDSFPAEHKAWVAIFVDSNTEPAKRFPLTKSKETIEIYHSEEEKEVTLTIMKYSEPEYAVCGIGEITIDTDNLLAPPASKSRKIQIIGDSITCGYGNEGKLSDVIHDTTFENPMKSYSGLLMRALDADAEYIAWNGKGVITSFIGDEDEIDDSWLIPMLYQYTDAGLCHQYFHEPKEEWERWDEKNFRPDLITVYLGTNDASYTKEIPERNAVFCKAYENFLTDIHTKQPQAKILCMLGTMDQRLCPTVEEAVSSFKNHNPDVDIAYLHLPMQDEEQDGLGTFWHPTVSTHAKQAELIIARAKQLMNWD